MMNIAFSFKAEVFEERRRRLAARFPNTVFLIPAGREAMRSHSVAYRFQSPSDFRYLTGLRAAPDAVLMLANGQSRLFLNQPDADQLLWNGETLASDERDLIETLEVERVERLAGLAGDAVRGRATLAFPIGRDAETDALALKLAGYRRGARAAGPLNLVDSRTLVGSLREIKEANEIAALHEAARRTSLVHRGVMSRRLHGRRESEVAFEIESDFLRAGLSGPAYGTIVGAGDRTTILHARPGERVIALDELVLIDAGGEWNGYCADVTRTLPSGRRFTSAQRELYGIVLDAQKAAIAAVAPGRTLREIDFIARECLIDGLARAGMDEKEVRSRISEWQPHGTSHWIGLDVHDPTPYHDESGEAARLRPGMSFTIEPGLYFRSGAPVKFGGLGIRIEDDIMVTEAGCEVLSDAPKEIIEIEELRARG